LKVFWNVAGVGNKEREFWETLDSEVLILMKIWMEEKN